MSEQLDRRIRDLYAELTEATPPLPPLPDPASRPASRLTGRWFRLPVVALSAAALLALIVATAGVLSFAGRSGDTGDASAETTTTVAAPTTMSATTTSGDAADTTGAPGTTGAATTLAPDVALSAQCDAFARTMQPLLGAARADSASYEAMLTALDGEVFGIRTVVVSLPSDDRLAADDALDVVADVVAAARGDFASVESHLGELDTALTELGPVLTGVGAERCAVLGGLVP